MFIKGIQVLVSQEDIERVMQWKWHLRSDGYVKGCPNQTPLLLHHVIIGKPKQGFVVDHINNVKTDNRRENLRHVTHSQNSQNVQKRKGPVSSMYMGVHFDSSSGKWRATCGMRCLKRCAHEEDAARQRDEAVLLQFGRDARTNFVYTEAEKDEILRRSSAPARAQSKQRQRKEVCGDIVRNTDGVAVVNAKDYNTGEVCQLLVDDDMWATAASRCWGVAKGYPRCKMRGKAVLMHQLVLGITENKPQGKVVDHINNNPLDNRRRNLRICSHSDNCQNRAKQGGSSSYIGVRRRYGKYEARICKAGVRLKLGCFSCEIEAALAYDKKAHEIYTSPRVNFQTKLSP